MGVKISALPLNTRAACKQTADEMSERVIDQVGANYGPGAICGPLGFSIRPVELKEMILIASFRDTYFVVTLL